MHNNILDVIVVGAGQSGLAASYFLKQQNLKHIVLERGRIGESWRSQRWDSFKLNTANKLNVLPGDKYEGNDPDGFCTAQQFADSLQNYQRKFNLPVIENAIVQSIEKDEHFKVTVNSGIYYSKQVIIASGEMSEMKTVSTGMHSGQYKNASLLPPGAVLIIGSAQSGVQIAEDLLDAGRQVFLSTSMVPRVPGQYRGKDIMDWLLLMGFFDMRQKDDKTAPLLTGIGKCRRTISLQSVAKKGAVLLGTFKKIEKDTLHFLPNAIEHIQFGDAFSQRGKAMIDEFIQKTNRLAPEPEPDKNDEPYNFIQPPVTTLPTNTIGTIIWANGFTGNYDYIKLPVLDNNGMPIHEQGVSPVHGLYFLGLHWLRTRKSGLIMGIADDAEYLVNLLCQQPVV